MQRGDNRPTTGREPAAPATLSLNELADAARVTVRTIRYYIAEGLLPPPVGAGPQSGYTTGHLDRLRLISRLKDAYLPLKEIRRQLTGLDDAAVRAALTDGSSGTGGSGPAQAETAATSDRSTARDYLDAVLAPATLREDAATYQVRERSRGPAPPAKPALAPPLAPDMTATESWRRVRLTDDAELLIRDGAYRKHRDRIEWLIGWARRVLN